jgi:hypothetical protein
LTQKQLLFLSFLWKEQLQCHELCRNLASSEKEKKIASEEHIFNKLSKHGFDVREGVYTRVTKEMCTHGDFVVPG